MSIFEKIFSSPKSNDIEKVLSALSRNEISITAQKAKKDGDVHRSKIGGNPAVPAGFIWPRFNAENYDGEIANRPLSFICQINLEEIKPYDKDNLLPDKGALLFFYEQESMRWGFDPQDNGCSRVYYFEDVNALTPVKLPDDLNDEYRIKEYDLRFTSKTSFPSFEELDCYLDTDFDWEEYDEAVEKNGYNMDFERHKILGYANLVQGEMLTECERTTRGLYCGDPESYKNTPKDVEEAINEAAKDWILLFQMASIQDKGYELMFGDLGNIYFYIRKQDLAERNFDKTWIILQCG